MKSEVLARSYMSYL